MNRRRIGRGGGGATSHQWLNGDVPLDGGHIIMTGLTIRG